jgi:hypothetical protein
MCNSPWSDRDTFEFISSCTVYQPIHILLNTLVLFYATIAFTYGLQQLTIQKRRDIPLCATLMGGFFMLNYLTLLCTGMTYADGNYGINFLHGTALSFAYLNSNLHNFRNLEVVRAVDTYTTNKTKQWATHSKRVNFGLFLISSFLQYLKMLLPIDTNINFVKMVGSTSIFLATINVIPRILYSYELKKILVNAQSENPQAKEKEKEYAPLIKELTAFYTNSFFGVSWTVILNIVWMATPVLRENSYLIYNIQMLGVPTVGITSLRATRGGQTGDENSSSKRATTQKTGSSSQRDRGVSNTEERMIPSSVTATPIATTRNIAGENPARPAGILEGEESAPLVSIDSSSSSPTPIMTTRNAMGGSFERQGEGEENAPFVALDSTQLELLSSSSIDQSVTQSK